MLFRSSDAVVKVDGAAAGYQVISGLSLTVHPMTNSMVYVSSDGGVRPATQASTARQVDIRLFVDGIAVSPGGYQRIAVGSDAITHWSMSLTLALPVTSGGHKLEIRAALVSGPPVYVGGDATQPEIRAQISALLLNK